MTTSSRPSVLPPQPGRIPEELRTVPQWVAWRLEWRSDKWTKVPIDPKNGRNASSTDPTTWSTLEDALKFYAGGSCEGVGFVFTESDPFCGIDLDKCRDPAREEIEPEAQHIIAALDSYAELSPSGTGVHVILKGKKPDGGCRKNRVEIYDRARFLTITGVLVPNGRGSVEERQIQLDRFHMEVFGAQSPAASETAPTDADLDPPEEDEVEAAIAEFKDRANHDPQNGAKYLRLWDGDTSDYAGDESAAEFGFLSHLVGVFGHDPELLEELYRRSKLVRDKWDQARGGKTYGEITIENALASPPQNAPKTPWRETRAEKLAEEHDLEKTLLQIERRAEEAPGKVLDELLSTEVWRRALRAADSVRFVQVKRRLKAAKVPVGDLDDALKAITRQPTEPPTEPSPTSPPQRTGTAAAVQGADTPARVGARLAGQHRFLFVFGTLYRYEPSVGVYRPDGEQFVRAEVQRLRGDQAKKDFANETVYWLETSSTIKAERLNRFTEKPDVPCVEPGDVINVANGLLHWRTGKLDSHTPDFLSIVQLPARWDPDAYHERWDRFLNEVLPDQDQKTREVLEEMFGYCLVPHCCFEKIFVLTGGGSNGKSTVLDGLQDMLGRENVSNVSLQDLVENRFSLALLAGKRANIYDDLPHQALKDTGPVKVLARGSPVKAEKKGKDGFMLTNEAKLIFSANTLPDTQDCSHGFFRKLILFPFPHRFCRPDEPCPSGAKPAEPGLEAVLKTPSGLSYLLRLAVEGLRRLEKRGGFGSSTETSTALEDYRRQTDSVQAFVDECCCLERNAVVDKATLYLRYKNWAENDGYQPLRARLLYQRLRRGFGLKEGPRIQSIQSTEGGRARTFKGIALLGAPSDGTVPHQGQEGPTTGAGPATIAGDDPGQGLVGADRTGAPVMTGDQPIQGEAPGTDRPPTGTGSEQAREEAKG